jgi:ferredoxin
MFLILIASLLYMPTTSGYIFKPRLIRSFYEVSARGRWDPPAESSSGDEGTSTDRIYEIELPKRAGIDWGTDLSFKWPYVIGLDEQGEAFKSGLVEKGDYIVGIGNVTAIAQDFDFVLTTLAKYPEDKFIYTFFRGDRSKLIGEPILSPSETNVRVTVQQEGKPDIILNCPGGTNLRQILVSNGINVYRSLTRWTNCNGKQRCGTCIVDVKDGLENCSRKALDEEVVLRENPNTYRLSCVTSIYGDVTVQVQGPVGAAQWTR